MSSLRGADGYDDPDGFDNSGDYEGAYGGDMARGYGAYGGNDYEDDRHMGYAPGRYANA